MLKDGLEEMDDAQDGLEELADEAVQDGQEEFDEAQDELEEADDGVQVEDNVEILTAYSDKDLAKTLKAVLKDRPTVVQDIADWIVPDRAYISARIMTDNRFCGRVKSFSTDNGYGFIECPPVKEAFGNDAFLHGGQLSSFRVGDEVSFVILLNKQRKPQAFDLGPAVDGKEVRRKGAVGKGGPPGKGGKGWQYGLPAPPAPPSTSFYSSQSSKAKGSKGAGPSGPRVSSAPSSIPSSAPTGLRMGMAGGQATRAPLPSPKGGGGKGKGGAYSAFGDPMATRAPPAPKGGGKSKLQVTGDPMGNRTYHGVVKSTNPVKGFGFLECEETFSLYGNDVFMQKWQLPDLQPGQAVAFSIILNKDGKPQAKDIFPQQKSGKRPISQVPHAPMPSTKKGRF